MKQLRFTLLLIISLASASAIAQAPLKFNYQAVARDASGNPITGRNISVRISILEGSAGGSALYGETHTVTPGSQGLCSLQIGGGTVVTGNFANITWASGARFLKVEIDPLGGSSFVLLGTSQLLSVPYALAADKLSSPMSIAELSNVSDTAPEVDQVLKWNGTEWVPGTGAGGAITTSTSLSGNGSLDSPLTIAQQSAVSGQVLQWNGTQWSPATVSGGVGDNWGTQGVVTSTLLSGNGTTASPLTISTTGVTGGSVLKYNGTAWAPAVDGGDNWGTAKVNTSTQFEGDGTPGNPLKLGANSAQVGQSLVWDGSAWLPDFAGGGVSLPFSASNGVVAGVAFQILSAGGSSIEGQTTNNAADMAGVRGIVGNLTPGLRSAGVFGRNIANNGNGYGVHGIHESTGAGVFGEAKGGAGYGVYGQADGANGVGLYGVSAGNFGYGVYGLANVGVQGVTNTANGSGVQGSATNGGSAGRFEGKVVISHNSNAGTASLTIRETDPNADYARLRLDNNNVAKYWDISAMTTAALATDRFKISNWNGNEVMTITGDGAVGLSTTSAPIERLDVAGTIRLTGGIRAGASAGVPGTLGNNGQVLQSTGAGVVWASPTAGQFNNTYLYWQDATSLNNISTAANTLSGLTSMSFTITGPARAAFTFSHAQLVSNGTGDVDLQVEIGFINTANGQIVNRAICNDVILNNKKKTFAYTHHCFFGTAGTYQPYVYIGTANSGRFNAVGSATANTGQAVVVITQQ